MTTEEFEKKIKELGFEFINGGSRIIDIFESNYERRLARIDADHVCVFNLCENGIVRLDDTERKKLAKVVIEYAMTPIEERDQKRYFQYRLKPISNRYLKSDIEFLNYLKDRNNWFIGNYKNGNICQTVFEENDPKLDEVNLEMFAPIEVDKEGNEL